MPRQVRSGPPPKRLRQGRTVLGLPWPLPVSPVVILLLVAFGVAAGVVWWVEGRYETPPSQVAKQVIPFKGEDVQTLEVSLPDGQATFNRGPDGKMSVGGPPPTPTPQPPPDATPGPVQLSPASRVESLVNQLATLQVERTLPEQSINLADYGLDQPKTSIKLVPKSGTPLTLLIGEMNAEKTSYYVRREERKDTILVSRYSLDDLLDLAREVVRGPATPTPSATLTAAR